jgi:hypothetical protein
MWRGWWLGLDTDWYHRAGPVYIGSYPWIAAVSGGWAATAALGQQETFNVDFHACRLTLCPIQFLQVVRQCAGSRLSNRIVLGGKKRHAGAAHDLATVSSSE